MGHGGAVQVGQNLGVGDGGERDARRRERTAGAHLFDVRPDTLLQRQQGAGGVAGPKSGFGLNELQLVVGNDFEVAQVAGVPAGVEVGDRGAGREVEGGAGARAGRGPSAGGRYHHAKARVRHARKRGAVQVAHDVGRERGRAKVRPRGAEDAGRVGERRHGHLKLQLRVIGRCFEGVVAQRQHGAGVVAALFGEVLGLAGFQGVGQALPLHHVALVKNVAALAGSGAVEGPKLGAGGLQHFHQAFVAKLVDDTINLRLRVVLGREVGPALVGFRVRNVAQHVGGVGQNHGLHDFAGSHVVGRALFLRRLHHGRNVATRLEVGEIEGIGAVGVSEKILVVATAVGRAAHRILRDEGHAQGREHLHLDAVGNDARQQEIGRGDDGVVGVVVHVEKFLARGEGRKAEQA